MPTLSVAEASDAAFSPSYIPVAIIVGGTSGVGQAMAEALARQTNGRAHIIIVGRNKEAAAKILASFPKPVEPDGWAHEFISCDATSMASVRTVCVELSGRLARLNFLVITAGGPAGNSMMESTETPEGLDAHLAMRYFMRYVFTKQLLPLLVRTQEKGQHAHVMTVLGAGHGITMPATDLGLHEARRRDIKLLRGSVAALKGMLRGVAYNDALVAYFAAQHPELAFTHIHPGQVLTKGSEVRIGWLLAPLAWLLRRYKLSISVSQDECAQYMLYALLDAERGLFIRGDHGEVVSSRIFDPNSPGNLAHFDASLPAAHEFVRFHPSLLGCSPNELIPLPRAS
ncbi:hypothetical protein B0H11DRAFT_1733894 [Mycena galericulata]|nr:hypothetical protein B0H11DRAFT_1733894 [Mycena galericulata]